jgi:hypothetical protein
MAVTMVGLLLFLSSFNLANLASMPTNSETNTFTDCFPTTYLVEKCSDVDV